jgi:hypothetical protein
MLTTATRGAIEWSGFKEMLEGTPSQILQTRKRS